MQSISESVWADNARLVFFLVHLDAGLLFILTFVVIAVFCFSND